MTEAATHKKEILSRRFCGFVQIQTTEQNISSLCMKYQKVLKSLIGAFLFDLFNFFFPLNCLTEVSAFPTP